MPLIELLYSNDYKMVRQSGRVVVLHFYAVWAEECNSLNKILKEMSEKDPYREVIFALIAAEQFPNITAANKVTAVPTIVLLLGGEEVDRIGGADPVLLASKLSDLVDGERVRRSVEVNSLTKFSPVMLFMKGTPEQPACPYSKQMVDILRKNGINFKSFNVLKDSNVREDLKRYWPTFPQLYVERKVIGGLDQVKELAKSNQLSERAAPLDQRLKKLITQSRVMLFIKGDKNEPRCGFSRQLLEIVNKSGVNYETFDILKDEEVRQGLKDFSKWPTYPQVYVGGELIGGLDIIKEYYENGELRKILA